MQLDKWYKHIWKGYLGFCFLLYVLVLLLVCVFLSLSYSFVLFVLELKCGSYPLNGNFLYLWKNRSKKGACTNQKR